MKIFANIPTFFKAYGNLPQLTQFKKEIEKAKVAGDLEREKEYILKELQKDQTWQALPYAVFFLSHSLPIRI